MLNTHRGECKPHIFLNVCLTLEFNRDRDGRHDPTTPDLTLWCSEKLLVTNKCECELFMCNREYKKDRLRGRRPRSRHNVRVRVSVCVCV